MLCLNATFLVINSTDQALRKYWIYLGIHNPDF